MTSKLTREELEAVISTYGKAHVANRMAVELLAAMDSEPVAIVEPSDYVTAAQLVGEGPVRKAVHELYEGALRIGDKLYRHAQPSLVPDKMIYQDGVLFVLNNDMSSIERGAVAMRAWNACRAAMLQAGYAVRDLSTPVDPQVAEYEQNVMQAGNSPVIPGKWIPVSERLPAVGHKVLAYRPDAPESDDPLIRVATYVGKSAHGHGFDCYCKPTHWMPLPAAPQEVK